MYSRTSKRRTCNYFLTCHELTPTTYRQASPPASAGERFPWSASTHTYRDLPLEGPGGHGRLLPRPPLGALTEPDATGRVVKPIECSGIFSTRGQALCGQDGEFGA